MAEWIVTKGMLNLRGQFNAAFLKRDKASDGTIGDPAHAAGTSGHNPDDTSGVSAEWDGDADNLAEVRAIDVDSDLNQPGVTAQMVVDHIRKLPNVSSVLRYVIYNRKIYRAANAWLSETYTGASPHTEHIHFSGARSQASDENTTFDYRLEEINMPTAEEIATACANAVWAKKISSPALGVTDRTAGDWLKGGTGAGADVAELKKLVIALGAKADFDEADRAAVVAGILAGLSPAAFAAAVVAAVPADLAEEVASAILTETGRRLGNV